MSRQWTTINEDRSIQERIGDMKRRRIAPSDMYASFHGYGRCQLFVDSMVDCIGDAVRLCESGTGSVAVVARKYVDRNRETDPFLWLFSREHAIDFLVCAASLRLNHGILADSEVCMMAADAFAQLGYSERAMPTGGCLDGAAEEITARFDEIERTAEHAGQAHVLRIRNVEMQHAQDERFVERMVRSAQPVGLCA